MSFKLSEIINRYGGNLDGADLIVTGLAPTNTAKADELTFLTDKKYFKALPDCRASAIIIKDADRDEVRHVLPTVSLIVTDNPYLYYSKAVNLFHPRRNLELGVKNTASIGLNTEIGDNPAIANHVAIGNDVKIGKNCQIYPSVTICDGVVIGDDVIIYPGVTIYQDVKIGSGCIFHSGCVIGSDGFGYAPDASRTWHKIPQVGSVIIGNNVEIGANTTIDRGALEMTVIDDGVKIDNLVQIAHNVQVGAHTAIAANAGIAGGTRIGKYCQIGGGTNIIGHISIADYTVVGAASGVSKSLIKPDLYSSALPCASYKEWARTVAYIRNLSTTNERIKNLELALMKLQQGVAE